MALHTPEAAEGVAPCPVCDGEPRVLVVMRHPAMLRFTRQLLERECGCWVATEVRSGPSLARALDELTPDLLVIDAADFPSCCLAALDHIPRERVIVIGPELDKAYRSVALANGAAGWLAREEVADKLSGEMRRVLGCRHDPCPPGELRSSPVPRTSAAAS
jgi:DNA-binding NarL/FixJ family response regulator